MVKGRLAVLQRTHPSHLVHDKQPRHVQWVGIALRSDVNQRDVRNRVGSAVSRLSISLHSAPPEQGVTDLDR